MNTSIDRIRKREFEARIFISLSFVLLVCVLSYAVFTQKFSFAATIGLLFGISEHDSNLGAFLVAGALMALASLLRMWAGSYLSSHRVMAFRVQNDILTMDGPYLLVRNPIYLADVLAMCGFALCLPPTGLLLPLLISLHYLQLMKYEEGSFQERFKGQYQDYARSVPRILPSVKNLQSFSQSTRNFHISWEGFRNNALYVLFVPGFIVSAFTDEFFFAVMIGLPGVLDWAVIHTKKGLVKGRNEKMKESASRTTRKGVFDDVLYAQCWEDPQLDRAAYGINKRDVVFSITSGGCNTLTFLLDDPRKVIALDLNPHQNYVLELKIAAFKKLSYDEMLEFLGVRHSTNRLDHYRRLREALGEESRRYWDKEAGKIATGVIHCGRFEAYMKFLRTWVQRLIGASTVKELFELVSEDERNRFYQQRWANAWWWLFTRVFLSRKVMSLLFNKAFFQYLDSSFSFGQYFDGRVKCAITQLPIQDNYFLSYILLGNFYSEDHLPPYLRKENFEIIRARVDRIEIVCDSCDHFFSTLSDNSISKFNFTNIFEWMPVDAYEQLLRETIRVATDGAVITYRNLLVHRERPDSLADRIHPCNTLGQELHLKDLSFIYSNYVVEQIQKAEKQWNT